jgi:UDP-N-acetylmuramoyl-L-alanyl-D-glutamate--2,6-diaminopimelate ligase
VKTVGEVLAGAPLAASLPAALSSAPVAGIAYDSRKAARDFLFFAFPGARVDGRAFAQQAIEHGAIAVVSELEPPEGFAGTWLRAQHGRRALAIAARNFYEVDRRLCLTGITGTNGKTTTSYLTDSVLRTAGYTTGLVGTIEYRMAGKVIGAVNTTPESLDLLQLFSELADSGGTHATMEVSSHALALGRVYGIRFHTAVFTNLTRDHLDFHRTMENYFESKCLLFEGAGAPPPAFAVVNSDDAYGRAIQPCGGSELITYGLENDAAARACNVRSGFDGLHFDIAFRGQKYPVASPLPGRMNVYNILAAWCAGWTYGIDPETLAAGIAACRAVPGRFERVDEGQPFLVVVDYAHTDDALRNVISVARGLNPKRIITLFGCGGDRDRAKRPLMGDAAATLSDFVVLTSDNPRSEDPLAIINDAVVGLCRHDTPHVEEPDREKAIRITIEQARPGDIVILAGKGHETYQVLKDRTIAFDDRETARRILRSLGYGAGAQ